MAIKRRVFINYFLSISGVSALVAVFYPIFKFLSPPESTSPEVASVKAGLSSELPNNSAKIVKFGRKPVILIKTEQGSLKAFNATCTHLGCIVQFKSDTRQIWCACHNGVYDINGNNISGPPPKPLIEYEVKTVNDEMIIAQKS